MKKVWIAFLVGGMVFGFAQYVQAGAIEDGVKAYIKRHMTGGTYNMADEWTGKTRKLDLVNVGRAIKTTGTRYYLTAKFKDAVSGEPVEVDFHGLTQGGQVIVKMVVMSKVNYKARIKYDSAKNPTKIDKFGNPIQQQQRSSYGSGYKGSYR